MMYGPCVPPTTQQIAVISPQFCTGYPVDLRIVQKMRTLSGANFRVTDINGNMLFQVKSKFFSFHGRSVLHDAAGNPIASFERKLLSAHSICRVFRGESTDSKDLLFSVKKSSIFQLKKKFDVILASNTNESVCDFKIEGSWFEGTGVITVGNSSTIIARMDRKDTAQSVLLGKDEALEVTVYPDVDHAFIVALVVILEVLYLD